MGGAMDDRLHLFRRFFDSSIDLLCILRMDGCFLELSPSWEAALGYPLAFIKNKNALDFIHPDDLGATLAEAGRVKTEGQKRAFDNRYRCADNSYRWFRWTWIGDEDFIFATAKDITNLKQDPLVNINLQQIGFLETVVSHVPSMIFVKEARNLTFRLLNKSGESILGLKESDLLGKNDYDIFPSSQADFFTSIDRSVIEAGKVVEIPEEIIATSVGERWLHTRKVPVFGEDGTPELLIGISEDVTETRQAQRRLELLADVSELGIWEWNLLTDAVSYDERWCAILGYESHEVERHLDTWKMRLHPEDRESALEKVKDYLAGTSPFFEAKFRMRHRDGHWVPILSRSKVYRRAVDGTPISLIGTHFDLTNLQRAEDELNFQRQLAMHSAKLASIGELAAGIGHEVNNPLAVAIGTVEFLTQYCRGHYPDDSKLETYLGKAAAAAERIRKIVDGLRTLARGHHTEPRPVSLKEAVDTTLFLITEIYRSLGITVTFLEPSERCMINGDLGQLQQVFMNLLANAKDALEHSSKKEITISITRSHGEFVLAVRDSGSGIRPEHRPEIFNAFFTTKDVGKGTGLGLAITRRIVESMNGKISFETEDGKGTVFLVSFPVHHAECIGAVPNEGQEQYALVVDDEGEIGEIVQFILLELGFKVFLAKSGDEGLDLYRNQPCHLVISDLRMPQMSGTDFLERIVAMTPDENLPKLFILTGGVETKEILLRRVPKLKLDGVLYKPITRKQLQHAIHEAFKTKADP